LGRLLPERIQPGLQYAVPYPLEEVILLKTNEAQRLTVGGTDLDRALGVRVLTEDDSLLSGDQNLVQFRASAAPLNPLSRTSSLSRADSRMSWTFSTLLLFSKIGLLSSMFRPSFLAGSSPR